MSAEVVQIHGQNLAAGHGSDEGELVGWLRAELLPDRPEGPCERITLHRADNRGRIGARIATVPVSGAVTDERIRQIATDIALRAERDAKSPIGAPMYVALNWHAAQPGESCSQLPFAPSSSAPATLGDSTPQQMLTAMLAQSHNFSGEMMRRSVGMMVAQTAFVDRQIERLERENESFRLRLKEREQEADEACQRNHERDLERLEKQAKIKRGEELFGMFQGGVDLVKARLAPSGGGGNVMLAKQFKGFVDGLDDKEQSAFMAWVSSLPEQKQMKFGALVELASKVTEPAEATAEPKAEGNSA